MLEAVREPVTAYVALGANLGDAVQTVRSAMEAIHGLPQTEVRQRSSLYLTTPIDSDGPDYVNAVVEVITSLCAPDLLEQLQKIEQSAGRKRPYRNAPRTLDLDILLFGSGHVHSLALTVPHPRMVQRAFVLRPLAEIAPALVTPKQLRAVRDQAIEKL
ncbi:2-amino-4-hydroxy-6-hydroxymethyldihydropteridine diphosphokinase [Rhodoferax ferrireducens]|uniref:2-amino-4-hydroxy-6-hydroxymethyldihydropteridine pyrophosphokinase n=1 Tax=Rhodoferax ferrireducens TaxID=192843 RepID=A0ABU2C8E7_9BURK|nr:2-amino-4-hydroxy-6-hydroxymethyldihydropteridine diphosphokinase [Rhodoferax ferrireducens]MDR7377607.1 2-amino-4-hydroxy-6-hydroxymethyldihydropteridine diphosphokinase [Rhodoferax ferrireducens]